MSEEATTTKKCQFVLVKNTVDVEFDRQNCVLQWKPTEKKKKDVTTQISVRDVIGTESDDGLWTVHYVTKTKKKWSANTVTFKGEQDVCQQWTSEVKEAIAATGVSRPKRPLVFINPDGGKKTGVKDYHSKVAPLFEKAGITAEVIVTEDVNHAPRVIAEYDLSTIDSILVMSGDGTLMKVVSALEQRMMKEAGRSLDDSELDLCPTQIPIGVMPAGSGQGMLQMLNEFCTTDLVTSALVIILGYITDINLLAVYNNNKFVEYCTLMVSYGIIGDLFHYTETNRTEGGMVRYLYGLLWHLFNPRRFDMTVHYQEDFIEAKENKDWSSISGNYTMLNILTFRIGESKENTSFLKGPAMLATMDSSAGRMGIFKHIYHVFRIHQCAFKMPGLTARDIKTVRFELPFSPDGSTIQHKIIIDGEAFFAKSGEVLIRLHRKYLKIFGQVPELTVPSAAELS